MHTSSTPGLRDRKKLDTVTRVQRVAVDLAIDRGSDAVTVEEICAASDISPRTFFNYFPTKETAILGRPLELLPPDEVRGILTDHPGAALRGVVAVLDRCFAASDAEPDLMTRRRVLMEAEPQLIPRQMAAFDRLEQQLVVAVSEWLEGVPAARRSTDLAAIDEARLTVLLAVTVIRRSIMEWVAGASTGGRERAIDATLSQLEQIVKGS
ncbi:MAG: hypothetical protein RI885_2028 [Actinomycetota bacterium]|jgi:AcrR family transcriptional regulator